MEGKAVGGIERDGESEFDCWGAVEDVGLDVVGEGWIGFEIGFDGGPDTVRSFGGLFVGRDLEIAPVEFESHECTAERCVEAFAVDVDQFANEFGAVSEGATSVEVDGHSWGAEAVDEFVEEFAGAGAEGRHHGGVDVDWEDGVEFFRH